MCKEPTDAQGSQNTDRTQIILYDITEHGGHSWFMMGAREEQEKDEDISRLKRIVDAQLTVDEKMETPVMKMWLKEMGKLELKFTT